MAPKNKLKLLLFLPLIFTFGISKAYHYMGSEFNYKTIDSLKYEIEIVLVKDCGVSTVFGSSLIWQVGCSTSTQKNLTAYLIETDSIANNCYTSGCDYVKYTYLDTIDLASDTNLSFLLNCCKIRLSVNACCVSSAITTGASGNYYNFSEFNICEAQTQNSPEFFYDTHYKMPCHETLQGNLMGYDTLDHDSLSYNWAPLQTNKSTNVSYSSGYAYNNPVSTYYPGSLTFPYNNPYASSPIGLHLDSKTGWLVFMSMNCQQYSVGTIEVKEWRKDSNGLFSRHVGSVRRVLSFESFNRYNYSSLDLDGPIESTVCAGDELNLTFSASNIYYNYGKSAWDTGAVQVDWTGNLKYAELNLIDSTFGVPEVKFTWQTHYEDSLLNPHYTSFRAMTPSCPYGQSFYRPAVFTVLTKSNERSRIVRLNDSLFAVYSVKPNGKAASHDFNYYLFDDSTSANSSVAYFLSDSTTTSSLKVDTVLVTDISRNFVLRTKVTHPNNCARNYYDTIQLDSFINTEIINTDSLFCANTELPDTLWTATTGFKNIGRLRYQWIRGSDTLAADTLAYLPIHLTEYNSNVLYQVWVTDSLNRTARDTFRVYTKPKAAEEFNDQFFACSSALVMQADSAFQSYSWSSGSIIQTDTFINDGDYSFTGLDSLGCTYFKEFNIAFVQAPELEVSDDTAICAEYTIQVLNYYSNSQYLWSTGSTDSSIVADTTRVYSVEVTDSNGCTDIAFIDVEIYTLPDPELVSDSFCLDSVQVTAQSVGSYLWNTGSASQTIMATNSGWYSVEVTDSNSCYIKDSAYIHLYKPIKVKLRDSMSCGNAIKLTSNVQGTKLWNTGSSLNQIFATSSGTYWLHVTDVNGCESSDTADIIINGVQAIDLRDSTQCGGTITLDAGNYKSYLWSNGDTTSTITVTTSGTYSITAKDNNNCEVFSSAVINIDDTPQSGIDDTHVCDTAITLTIPNYDQILWSAGNTTRTQEIKTSGKYYVEMETNDGCYGTDSFYIGIHHNPTVYIPDSVHCGDSFVINPGMFHTYAWSTGDSTPTIAVKFSGFYYVSVVDSFGCTTTSNTANIKIRIPPQINMKDTTYCGNSLKLFTPLATNYLWSTGATTRNGDLTSSGTYWARIGNNLGCYASDTFEVTLNPKPSFYLNDTTVCEDSLLLGPSLSNVSLSWNTGETYSPIAVDKTGYYELTVTNSYNCTTKLGSAVKVYPELSLDLGNDTTKCQGTMTIDPGFFDKYEWSNGSTSRIFQTDTSGTYNLKASMNYGCVIRDTIEVEILNYAKPTITREQGKLWSSYASGNQWYRNDSLLAGETNNNIVITSTGDYSVQYTDQTGCKSTMSDKRYTDFNSIASLDYQFRLYPQPSKGQVTLAIDPGFIDKIQKIEMYTLYGQEITIETSRQTDKIQISWTGSHSTLILQVTSDLGVHNLKVIDLE